MRRSLERSDTLINLRNQEIATLNSRLAAKDEAIAEAAEQFDRLDREVTQLRSQLEGERADLKQKSTPAVANFPEPADLLNQLKARRKKSKADLVDIEAVLDLLTEAGT